MYLGPANEAAPPGTSLHCNQIHCQLQQAQKLEGAPGCPSARSQCVHISQHSNSLLQLHAIRIQVQLQCLELHLLEARLAHHLAQVRLPATPAEGPVRGQLQHFRLRQVKALSRELIKWSRLLPCTRAIYSCCRESEPRKRLQFGRRGQ